jgi:hypothetical protein
MVLPVQVVLLHALVTQPVAGELGSADLAPVFNLANKLRETLHCEPVAPGADIPAEQRRAASEYVYLAGMYALAASRYPTSIPRGDREEQIDDLVLDAAATYEHAYDCAPDDASSLHRAVALLSARVDYLTARAHPDAERLHQRAEQLRHKLPPPPRCPSCPPSPPCPACEKPAPPRGYRGLHAGRLTLSAGLGGGAGFFSANPGGALGLFSSRFAFGPRFPLGARKRHVLGAGVEYVLHVVVAHDMPATISGPANIHQAGPYLAYAFVPHPHFALQVHGSLRVTAGSVGPKSFVDLNPGGSASVCTLGMALCASVGGFASSTGGMNAYSVMLEVDAFRVVDLALTRRQVTRQPGPRTSSR